MKQIVWGLLIGAMLLGAGWTAAQAQGEEPSGDAIEQMVGKKFSRGSRHTKKIALTFDDGPHPTRTPQVISILQEKGVTANFFWVGQMVEQYPQVAKQVADAGFEIGSHSMTHPNLTRQTRAKAEAEIGGAQDLIEQTTGVRPRFFRPPGGNVNKQVYEISKEQGVVICMWSVDPRDWEPKATVQSIHDKVMAQAAPGAIVCMHDVKEKTVQALPGIIDDLKAQGYELTTISQLIEDAAQDKALGQSQDDAGDESAGYGYSDPANDPPVVIPLDQSGL